MTDRDVVPTEVDLLPSDHEGMQDIMRWVPGADDPPLSCGGHWRCSTSSRADFDRVARSSCSTALVVASRRFEFPRHRGAEPMNPDDWTPELADLEVEKSRRYLMHWVMGILALTVVLYFAAVFWVLDAPTEGAIAAVLTPIIGLAGGATGFYFAQSGADADADAKQV